MAGLYTVATGGIIQAADINQLVTAMPFFNVKAYGALGDGTSDDTTPIANARSDANAAGGGFVYYPPGTYITGNQPIYAKVHDLGAGKNATMIKLKAGANTDLFSGQTSSINLAASFASSIDGTLYNFGWHHMTLNGGKANQTGGPSYCIRVYGYSWELEDVEIKNGYSGGILGDWNGSTISNFDGVEAQWINVKVHDHGGPGIQLGGPHDSQAVNLFSYSNGGHNLHLAPNMVGFQLTNFHLWGNFGTGMVGLLNEGAGNRFVNGEIESPSDTYCVVLLGQNHLMRACRCSGFGSPNTFTGIKLGQDAGETPISGQILQAAGVTTYSASDFCMIDIMLYNCLGTHGALNFDKVHNSMITAHCSQASGSVYSGFLDPTNHLNITVDGLTPDGTVAKGGQSRIAVDATEAFAVSDTSYNEVLAVDTHAGQLKLQLANGTYIQYFSDAYATATSALRAGSGAPSNGTGSNGDYYLRSDTPGTANQRLYVKSAGAWVGIL